MDALNTENETVTPAKGNGSAAVTDAPEAPTEQAAAPATPTTGAPGSETAGSETPEADAGMNVLAGALSLMLASPRHRHLFLADLEWALLPPLALKQFRLFTKAGKPIAFATWAFVSEEVEQRLKAGQGKLRPGDWKSGERCRIVDVVAPNVPAAAIVESLKKNVLQGQEVST